MYNLCTIYVQFMYNLCTIYVQFMYNLCTIYVIGEGSVYINTHVNMKDNKYKSNCI